MSRVDKGALGVFIVGNSGVAIAALWMDNFPFLVGFLAITLFSAPLFLMSESKRQDGRDEPPSED